jgi:outer membrane protein assembly factor BamA
MGRSPGRRTPLTSNRSRSQIGSWPVDVWRGRRRGVIVLAACACVAATAPARAEDPLNSNDKTSTAEPVSRSAPSAPSFGDRAHTDVNVLPVVGGTSDIGFGVGEFVGIARQQKGYDPYLWNLESVGLVTFESLSGRLAVPYQDLELKLTVPRLIGAPVRLVINPSYTWEQALEYDGMGNASSAVLPAGATSRYRLYGRLHPALDVRFWWRLVDHLAASVGATYTQNWIQVTDDSKLASDLHGGTPEVKTLLGSTASHAVALFQYGLQWDTRDSEVSTHRGTFHEAIVKLSPGGAGMFPYRYAQGTLESEVFLPIGQRVTVALRGIFDIYVGNPPFYELAKYDNTYALGGLLGVRGVPAERYYGKVKLLGNAEVRTDVATFQALGKKLLFGFVGFFDGGRLWADTTAHPELDGTSIGLKYGTGGGLRLQSGEAFVLRADIAWSPDARPISAYFAAGQMF